MNRSIIFYTNIFILRRRYAEAEQDAGVALSLDPTMVKAYLRRGQARMQMPSTPGARQDFEHALKLDPGNKMASDLMIAAKLVCK